MVTQEELEKMSPEEIAELQKQNCPFCKIVKGEIPSSNVFSDDDVMGILDINPAKKGHVLLMPKEHVPIMPVCPPNVFKKLFHTARLVSIGQKKGVLVPKTTLFIANGAVAGQQAAHFLFHVIPREEGDGLNNFSVIPNEAFLPDQETMFASLKNNMTLMMQKHAQREGKSYAKQKVPLPSSPLQAAPAINPEKVIEQRKEQIAQIIESNPQLKELLINNPEEFKKQVALNEQLKSIFEGVDLDSLSQGMKVMAEQEKEKTPETSPKPASEQVSSPIPPPQTDKKPEVFLGSDPYAQKEKVFAYFGEKPKAKELLTHDLAKFKELLAGRSDIQELFKDVNLDKLSEKLVESEKYKKEQEEAKNE